MIDGYVIAIGFWRGESGDAAFRKCAEQVMHLANTKGMIPQGGVSVVLGSDSQGAFYVVTQAMVLPKAETG